MSSSERIKNLKEKYVVSANPLNEMFGNCKRLKPSESLKDDIAFNKGLVEMFGLEDVIPNVTRVEIATGFGGTIQSASTNSNSQNLIEEPVALENEVSSRVTEVRREPKVKREYVKVDNFEII